MTRLRFKDYFVVAGGLSCVLLAALSLTFAATASADAPGGKTIQGQYAVIGSGNCFIAINGFNASLQPNDGANGMWLWGPLTYDAESRFTFNKDGTGSFTGAFQAFDNWSPFFINNFGTPPDMGKANETWDFTYTVTNSGNITITYTKGTFELDFTSGPNVGTPLGVSYVILPLLKGAISPDGKLLHVSFGAPDKLIFTSDKANNNPTPTEAICNVVDQAFRISP
jgi:hypothetical protein